MSDHEVTISAGPAVDLEAGFFRGECSCGWRGNNVWPREHAAEESMAHARSGFIVARGAADGFVEPSAQWLAWHEEAGGDRDKMFDLAERDLATQRGAVAAAPLVAAEAVRLVQAGQLGGSAGSVAAFARSALAALAAPPCAHEWADARNRAVASGEFCPKCGAVR